MNRRDIILIAIGLIVLIGLNIYWKDYYKENVNKLENEIKQLNIDNSEILFKVKQRNLIINELTGNEVYLHHIIDSLKNFEYEIPHSDISSIPPSERDSTIIRLAKE